jgi:hypothetical protein
VPPTIAIINVNVERLFSLDDTLDNPCFLPSQAIHIQSVQHIAVSSIMRLFLLAAPLAVAPHKEQWPTIGLAICFTTTKVNAVMARENSIPLPAWPKMKVPSPLKNKNTRVWHVHCSCPVGFAGLQCEIKFVIHGEDGIDTHRDCVKERTDSGNVCCRCEIDAAKSELAISFLCQWCWQEVQR